MSLVVEIQVPHLTLEEARKAEDLCRERAAWPLDVHAERLKGRVSLTAPPEWKGMCLWSDAADWDAETWAMTSAGSHLLSTSVLIVGGVVSRAFVLQAIWAGERAGRDEPISLDGIVGLVARSALRGDTQYLVSVPDPTRG